MGADPQHTLPSQAPSREAFIAYGSGAPRWFGLPIFIAFFMAVVVAVWLEVPDPNYRLRGVLFVMNHYAYWVAGMAAFAVWRWLAWRLRGRYPDKLLVAADDSGVRLSSGKVIPYSDILGIDPHVAGNRFVSDTYIRIVGRKWWQWWKIDLNFSVDAPDTILANLRRRALDGGARLTPARFNGRKPRGTQLGYREGMDWRG